jgi:phosphatidylethanolamine/phosphatidyl-N-methylethanolamine N-methyltransferase
MRYWTECQEFYQEFRRAYRNTGSILPSSRGLARALVSPMRKRQGPARILEVGPGTGAVTDEILRQLRPGDRFDLVEINPHFVEVLRRRFETEPPWRSRRPQTDLIHAPLQDVPGVAVYDFMISGLPLNNFPLSLVREIFQAYRRLLKPAGILSYFEYLAIRDVKIALVAKKEQRRLRVLSKFLERRIRAHQVSEQQVFLNIPPAVARHFCFSPAANSAIQQVR